MAIALQSKFTEKIIFPLKLLNKQGSEEPNMHPYINKNCLI
jgi:hypothetical protein